MKKLALILTLLLLTAMTNAAPPAPDGLTRIHFARGKSEAVATGRMTSGDLATDYVLSAKAGQRLTARLESAPPGAVLTVIGPAVYLERSDRVRTWAGRLPKSGEYVFRITSPRPTLTYSLHIKISALAPRTAPADTALTGSYDRGDYGDIDVQALPGDRVHFHLFAFAHPDSPSGPNIGEAEDVVRLHHGVGVYTSPEKGHLLLRFTPSRVIVTQNGASWDLDFGMGVDATGVYKKNSSKPPKFDAVP